MIVVFVEMSLLAIVLKLLFVIVSSHALEPASHPSAINRASEPPQLLVSLVPRATSESRESPHEAIASRLDC